MRICVCAWQNFIKRNYSNVIRLSGGRRWWESLAKCGTHPFFCRKTINKQVEAPSGKRKQHWARFATSTAGARRSSADVLSRFKLMHVGSSDGKGMQMVIYNGIPSGKTNINAENHNSYV